MLKSTVAVGKNKMGIEVVEVLCEIEGTWHKAAEIRLDHVLSNPEVFQGLVREYWYDPEEGTSLDLFYAVFQAIEFWIDRMELIAYSEEFGYSEILRVEGFFDTAADWELVQVARGWWDDPTGETEGWEVRFGDGDVEGSEEKEEYERWASSYLEEIWQGKFNCPASYLK